MPSFDAETAHANDYEFMDGVEDAVHEIRNANDEDNDEYEVKLLRDNVRKGDWVGQRLAAETGSTRFIYWAAESGAPDPKNTDRLVIGSGDSAVAWIVSTVLGQRLGGSWILECVKAAVDG